MKCFIFVYLNKFRMIYLLIIISIIVIIIIVIIINFFVGLD